MAEKPKAIIIASRPRLKADIGTKQIDWIRAALQKARFSVKFPTDGSVSSAADLLEETQPQVVHFVGHAAISIGDGCLVFESEDRRRTEWITADELANLLPPSVGLVCLSTPVSVPNYQIRGFPRLAQAAVATSLPTMVVNQFDHSDTIDELFWRTFYSALTTDNLNGDICQAVSTTWRVIANLDARPDGPQVPTSFNSPGASREWPAFSVFVRDGSGIPFRFFSPTPPLSPDKIAKAKALEIEAALRIRQANDLAERLPQFSPKAAAALRGEIELQINRANSMSEKLIQIGEE